MNGARKAYLPAAMAAGGITAPVVSYTATVELLRADFGEL